MKGFILAAGVGSRLKPWTDSHPKALVPVDGVPMLQRIVEKMFAAGITDITVNLHHFADQIISFIHSKGWNLHISDESGQLLETGGALLKAAPFLEGDQPILVHNADILSNADFRALRKDHLESSSTATLLVSDRESSRKLIFDSNMRLKGWHNLSTGCFRPDDFTLSSGDSEWAFSGIYMVSPSIFPEMRSAGWEGRFSIMDFFLASCGSLDFKGVADPNLQLLDIGKPDALHRASEFLRKIDC